MKYLGIEEKKLLELNSYNTAKEIAEQPIIWKKAVENYEKNREEINAFLEKVGEDALVAFSGAGTSEYVGNILEPLLNQLQGREFKSLATTNVVNNPEHYLRKNKKLLLVSFARSGDSPESVATVNLANQLVNEVYHLFITCNPNGELAKMAKTDKFKNNTLVLMMPEGSNDKGFAMTSSFSSMLMTAILVFQNSCTCKMKKAIELAEKELVERLDEIKSLANEDQERIIILGDGAFKGLAEELTLKVMELTAGKVVAKSDTTLGFRHGPKSVINNKTIVFSLLPVDNYPRKYALDILQEMKEENKASNIVCYSLDNNDKIRESAKKVVSPNVEEISVEGAIFTYLVYGQMYAFFKSQYFNLTTDNPFPSGDVNRVVKKFQIYEF